MISVILMEPALPGNIGAVARAMKNFGFSDLVLIDPQCEHWTGEARKRAKHGLDVLENARVESADVLASFDAVVATTARLARDYDVGRTPIIPSQLKETLDPGRSIALLFGREGDGLTREEIEKADVLVTIPASEEYPTLNLSHAVTILLYELGRKNSVEHINPMTEEEKRQILSMADSIIDSMEWQTDSKRETQKQLWRNILGRSFLSRREAFALMGFLKRLKD